MNSLKTQIIQAIDQIFIPGSYFYSKYQVEQLKKQTSLDLVCNIIAQSEKTPAEAVIVLLAAIRYIKEDIYALQKIEEMDSFETVIKENYTEILHVSIHGKVQGNIPERGLPVLEILSKKMPDVPLGIIELGASYGLIGQCLLNPQTILEMKNNYFQDKQKIPETIKKADFYLGIDINPPDKDWLIACFAKADDAKRIKDYIKKINPNDNFQLIKASALGFSELQETKKFISKNLQIVILTSFMLYQLNEEQQQILINEIQAFCKTYNAHWIRQEVELLGKNSDSGYYIEWDREKIMNLKDDKCSYWEWLN
jgi:hypothetical protein